MTNDLTGLKMRRRRFLQTAATAGCGLSLPAFGQVVPPKPGTVRDKLWLFSNPINADWDMLHKRSVMSPFEAAVYMEIPNIFMVQQYPGKGQESLYKPFEPPFEQYTVPLSMLKRVAWSIVGASGVTHDWERQQVLSMAQKTPNFVGVYMDDFFHDKSAPEVASLSLEQLRDVRRQLKTSGKKMDSYVTFYSHQLDLPIAEHLKLIDVITLWMWKPEELEHLDSHFTRLDKLAPRMPQDVGALYDGFKRTPDARLDGHAHSPHGKTVRASPGLAAQRPHRGDHYLRRDDVRFGLRGGGLDAGVDKESGADKALRAIPWPRLGGAQFNHPYPSLSRRGITSFVRLVVKPAC